MRKILLSVLILLLLSLFTAPAGATVVYNTSASLVGSTNLQGFGDWEGNATLSWNIVDLGGSWNYNYTFSHDGSDLSHLVLQFSISCGQDPACITEATNNPDGPRLFSAFTSPNFELPADIFGVKFDFSGASPYLFSFTSNRSPVWGDMYARDGTNAYAYNAGLLNHESLSTGDFVARPDGEPIPDVATWLMFASGLFYFGLRRRQSHTL